MQGQFHVILNLEEECSMILDQQERMLKKKMIEKQNYVVGKGRCSNYCLFIHSALFFNNTNSCMNGGLSNVKTLKRRNTLRQ